MYLENLPEMTLAFSAEVSIAVLYNVFFSNPACHLLFCIIEAISIAIG
jgi:hypothetical protein